MGKKKKSNKPQLLESWAAGLKQNQFYLTCRKKTNKKKNPVWKSGEGETSGDGSFLAGEDGWWDDQQEKRTQSNLSERTHFSPQMFLVI